MNFNLFTSYLNIDDLPLSVNDAMPVFSKKHSLVKHSVVESSLDNDSSSIESKKSQNSVQVLQHFLFVSLLSEFCDIKIKRPSKKSKVTRLYARIKALDFGNDILDVSKFIKKRCNELKEQDIALGVSRKTIGRRYQQYKRLEMNNLLVDLLMIKGYSFKFEKVGKHSNKTLEILEEIYWNDELLYTKDNIISKSLEVKTVLLNEFHTSKQFIVKKQCKETQQTCTTKLFSIQHY
ncbi:TATA-binding protein-associated phosphoprotein [Entamoeba marina]